MARLHKTGDTVSYSNKGLCRIEEIARLDMMGSEKEYYVLSPMYDSHSKVYVPLENTELTERMRPALTESEAEGFIERFDLIEPLWKESEAERKAYYAQLLSDGERNGIVGMIKGIYNHRCEQESLGKKLHVSDERYIKEGERLIHGEIAYAIGIEIGEVHGYIRSKLG